jgi:hypothetical protein
MIRLDVKVGGFLFGRVFISYEPSRTNIKNQRGDGCNI